MEEDINKCNICIRLVLIALYTKTCTVCARELEQHIGRGIDSRTLQMLHVGWIGSKPKRPLTTKTCFKNLFKKNKAVQYN